MTTSDDTIGRLEETTPLLAGYESARDWLSKASRDLKRYKADPFSLNGYDAMFDTIVTLNHVRDWIFELHLEGNEAWWPDTKDARKRATKWREHVFEDCPAVVQLADIANASKHRSLRHGPRASKRLYEGIIVYSVEPLYLKDFRDRLASFGKIETVAPQVEDDEIMALNLRHRGHIIRVGEGPTDWLYFVDVANAAIGYWDRLVEEFEPEATYRDVLARRQSD
tara:strand:+ start:1538 stop:2209 length:672 start_codon:yes stop_codon:yes gene_type:complete